MFFLKSLDQVFNFYEDINAEIVLLYNLITTSLSVNMYTYVCMYIHAHILLG